jgi:hypothetical protein
MNQSYIIQSVIEEVLNEKQIVYSIDEDSEKERNVIHMGFNLESGIVNTYFVIHYSIQIVEFFTYLPINVPEEKRLQVSKFLDMVEATYFIGSFQLNHDDGRLRSKSYITYDKTGTSHKTIDLHLAAVNHLANETFPDVMKICFGNRDADSVFSDTFKRIDVRMN